MSSLFLFLAHLSLFAQVETVLDLDRVSKAGTSSIWSPLFQASWEKLNAQLGGLPTTIEPANELISELNKFQWKQSQVMPENGYGVYAGEATKEFAEKAAREVKDKFGMTLSPAEFLNIPGGVAVYGVLARDIFFKKHFYRSKKKPLAFRDGNGATHQAAYFGTARNLSDTYGNKVRVISYQTNPKSFVLEIATDRDDEKLMIYLPPEKVSFRKAFAQVNEALKAPLDGSYGSLSDGHLHKNDVVKIPYLSFTQIASFVSQLKGSLHYKGHQRPYRIVEAKQITNFDLNEKGAKVRIKTVTGADPFGEAPPEKKIKFESRKFICDAPFFAFLWREKAAYPYFAAWVDGPDFLQKFHLVK